MSEDQLLTRREVAALLSITPETLRKLEQADKTFPQAIRLPGVSRKFVRWRLCDLRAWMEAKRSPRAVRA